MKHLLVALLWLLTSPAHAKSAADALVVTAAAAMVEIAESAEGISQEEEWLIRTQFPLKNVNPVLVFTLDRTALPQALAQLNLSKKRTEKILVFLSLVAIVDNEIQPAEKALLLEHHAAHTSIATIDTILQRARKIQLRLRHKKLKEDLQSLAQAILKYYETNGYYIETDQYPRPDSTRPYHWTVEESGNFQLLGWQPEGTNFGCFQVQASEHSFTATAIIDVDNDGVFATYTTTHSNPESVRTTTLEVQ